MRVTREQESFSFVAAADSGAVCRPTLRDDSPRGMKSGGTGHGGRENCGGRRTSSRFIVGLWDRHRHRRDFTSGSSGIATKVRRYTAEYFCFCFIIF